jgi:hypothetical protein
MIMAADEVADGQPATELRAADDPTTVVPASAEAAHSHAWSNEEPTTEVLPRPWRSVWMIAGIGLLCGVVIAFAIFGVVALVSTGNDGKRESVPTTTLLPAAAPSSLPTASPAGVAQPPPTVIVQPAPTVTVTPPPATVTAQAAPPPASGGADVFTICPDGHEGVVGGHTTCAFAANVRQTFYATGMSNKFTAFSPVTGNGYEITCVGRYPAYFTDGSTKVSTRCYGGDGAEVVIW